MSHEQLKLGKGASFFVKTQLRRLRQEDETWEADFFPIPCSDSEHDSMWWGIVLSQSHDNVLAQRMVEEPPTVNDLAGLLAEAMRRPLVDVTAQRCRQERISVSRATQGQEGRDDERPGPPRGNPGPAGAASA